VGSQGNDQVKGHAHTGQVSKICMAFRPGGVDHGDGIAGKSGDRMMVGDDGMDAGPQC
jgi:hypothetical protein